MKKLSNFDIFVKVFDKTIRVDVRDKLYFKLLQHVDMGVWKKVGNELRTDIEHIVDFQVQDSLYIELLEKNLKK